MVRSRCKVGVVVANILVILGTDFWLIQVIDELLGQFFVFGAFGNGETVGPDAGAFLRNNKSDIGIFLIAEVSVAAPHGADPGFFRNKLLLDGIRVVSQNVGSQRLQVFHADRQMVLVNTV